MKKELPLLLGVVEQLGFILSSSSVLSMILA